MGGIIGNLIDRVRLGYVIDYLDFNIIIEIMADLSELERNLKYNLDDPQTALELFICNFRRNYAPFVFTRTKKICAK